MVYRNGHRQPWWLFLFHTGRANNVDTIPRRLRMANGIRMRPSYNAMIVADLKHLQPIAVYLCQSKLVDFKIALN